ncbi:MAG: glycosyltransferase family 9 protein [bacterium]
MIKNNNILIIRTDRIGDVVLTLPLAQKIKKFNPKAKLIFMVKEYTKPIVELNPYVDKIITIDNLSFMDILNIFKKEKFDTVIHVYPKLKFALCSFLAGIENRIGTGYRYYSLLFNKKVFEHRKSGNKHELEYNLQLLKEIGIGDNIINDSVDFSIHPDKESIAKINTFLIDREIDNKLPTIIIHPGSGGSAIDMPIGKFYELVVLLAQSLQFNVLITGSQNENDICEKLVVSKNVHNFSGKLSLKELIALINISDMLIANSTGPIHLAAALNKNVIGFYPKFNECSELRWGPYTTKKSIFLPTIGCNNCSREQCEKLNCMNSIDVNKVFKQIKQVLFVGENDV